MFSTYQSQDVTILLKDITGLVTPLGTREREARIQSGVHYSEMLPLEYEPSPAYLAAYHDALERYAGITAEAVARAAEQIWECRGRQCALVSLARAGTPIGILIRRYLQGRYGVDLPHYTISIIRGRGIDLSPGPPRPWRYPVRGRLDRQGRHPAAAGRSHDGLPRRLAGADSFVGPGQRSGHLRHP